MLRSVTGNFGRMEWNYQMQLIGILNLLFCKAQEMERVFFFKGTNSLYK